MTYRIFVFLILVGFLLAGTALAQEEAELTYEKALSCVEEKLPATVYSTNEYLPTEADLTNITPLEETVTIVLGFPWIKNDEEGPWYNAEELGYFADEGLVVIFEPGGPGINHLQTMAGGAVDIAISAGGAAIPQALASPTPIEGLMVVGTFLKGSPFALITIREDLLGKEITPADLEGMIIGTQSTAFFYFDMLFAKYDIPRQEDELLAAGSGPEVIFTETADFYTGWIMNQPRAVEAWLVEQGKPADAWNAMMYRDWVYDEYSDVIVVSGEMLSTEEGRDVVRRFMRATYRGLQYLLDNPEDSARIAVKYADEGEGLTEDAAMFRFEHQEFLIYGNDGLGLMATAPEKWNHMAATLTQYGNMPLECE